VVDGRPKTEALDLESAAVFLAKVSGGREVGNEEFTNISLEEWLT